MLWTSPMYKTHLRRIEQVTSSLITIYDPNTKVFFVMVLSHVTKFEPTKSAIRSIQKKRRWSRLDGSNRSTCIQPV